MILEIILAVGILIGALCKLPTGRLRMDPVAVPALSSLAAAFSRHVRGWSARTGFIVPV